MKAARLTLLRRSDLDDDGIRWRELARLVRAGELIAVRPGTYARAAEWADLTPEAKIVARARALDRTSSRRPVFSNVTSAAIHGLPVARCNRDGTHTIARDERTGPLKGVIRHRGPVADNDIEEVGGLLCTTLARTVSDVARTARAETSVSIADAALRRVAFRRVDDYRDEVAAAFRAASAEFARRSAYGTSRALRVLAFADGRAQLPGESISRLYLVRLGYRPRIQVAVAAPDDGCYFVDFDLGEGVGFGEFDGEGKYTDPAMLRGRTPAQAVADEKQREDWIRGTTQRRFARWTKTSLHSAEALSERLERFGMPPPMK